MSKIFCGNCELDDDLLTQEVEGILKTKYPYKNGIDLESIKQDIKAKNYGNANNIALIISGGKINNRPDFAPDNMMTPLFGVKTELLGDQGTDDYQKNYPKQFKTAEKISEELKSISKQDDVRIKDVLSKICQIVSKAEGIEDNQKYFFDFIYSLYNRNFCSVLDFCNQERKQQPQDYKYKQFLDELISYCSNRSTAVSEEVKIKAGILKQSKNIILHGAPGTGKTFLAKQIAEYLTNDNDSQIGFVQFHPSYDYTDFVEGLRPVPNDDNDGVNFKRKDGIFKEFVDKARKNYEDSRKTQEEITQEDTVEKRLSDFLSNVELVVTKFKTDARENEFTIEEIKNGRIYISVPGNEKSSNVVINMSELEKLLKSDRTFDEVAKIRDFLGDKYNKQRYSYEFALYKEIIDKMVDTESQPVTVEKEKPYIFIIDEINRGEISKIFGELFFSIDPGYRGKKGEVSTQYANLHEDKDEKFYIPENVYIIGTMNDIDRSVDSFDFAMRRRFRFIEITAKESAGMLDAVLCNVDLSETIDQIKNRMNNLNKAIEEVDGLGKSYHIGPSYFLNLKSINAKEDKTKFDVLWEDYIEPLLREYLRGYDDEKTTIDTLKNAYGYPDNPGKKDDNENES